MKAVLRSLSICVFALLLAESGEAADPIKIGAFLSITGPASFLGEPNKKALELTIARINKGGGLAGRDLQLISYDDEGLASKAQSFAKRLIESDNVDVVIGGSTTATSMAGLTLFDRAQIPFVSLAGSVNIVEPVKPWVFKITHTDRMAAEKIFADLKKRNLTKLALISEDSGFGKSAREQALLVCERMGIKIVADETYTSRDPDMSAQLTKIKSNSEVQALWVLGTGQGPVIVTKNYKQLGLTMPIYQAHSVASKEFIRLAGESAEGVRIPVTGLVLAELLPANDPQRPLVLEFKRDYEAAYKTEASTFAGYGFDAMMLYADATKRANSFDKAKVRDALEATHGFLGTVGEVNLSAADHMGLTPASFYMVEIKGGDWKLLD
ncbi:ABC transporter substrate-binding protein [Bradyrhizobium sp. LA7.1]|uniref:ABC transporter substrate-binding protein n=1 Tax=Bradyrhizobium sp. LA7.1 TaxID=3156324 RepID=UPI00339704DC